MREREGRERRERAEKMDRHAVSALVRPPLPSPGSTLPTPELLPGRAARSKNLGDQAQIWCLAWAQKSQDC